MSENFDINANLVLNAPKNLDIIARQVENRFSNIKTDVKINFNSNLSGDVNKLSGSFSKLNSELASAANNSKNVTVAFRSMASAINNFSTRIKQASNGSSLEKINKDSQSADRSMSAFSESIAKTTLRFSTFVVVASTFNKLVNSIGEGISDTIKYQNALIKLSQVGNDSKQTIKGISDEIIRLSTGLGVASSDLIHAAQLLRQAGFSADQTKKSLDALASASLAPSFTDFNNAIQGLIAIKAQFGATADDFKSILGSINAVSNEFAVESNDLVTGIRTAGAAFKQAGGDLDQFLALFTVIKHTTQESSESIATALKTIFARIQRPEIINQFKELGVQLRDAQGNFTGGYEAFKKISQAMNNLNPQGQLYQQLSESVAGERQYARFISAIKNFDQAEKALLISKKGQNSIDESTIKAQDSLIVKLTKVREEFLSIFKVLSESDNVKKFADFMLGLAKAATTLVKSLEPLIPILTAVGAFKIAGPVIQGFAGALGIRRATGGSVPGSGDTDSVPAMLTPGEEVIKKSSVRKLKQKFGPDFFNILNNHGNIPHFAEGGNVPNGPFTDQDLKNANVRLTKSNRYVDLKTGKLIKKDAVSERVANFSVDPLEGPHERYIQTTLPKTYHSNYVDYSDPYGFYSQNLTSGSDYNSHEEHILRQQAQQYHTQNKPFEGLPESLPSKGPLPSNYLPSYVDTTQYNYHGGEQNPTLAQHQREIAALDQTDVVRPFKPLSQGPRGGNKVDYSQFNYNNPHFDYDEERANARVYHEKAKNDIYPEEIQLSKLTDAINKAKFPEMTRALERTDSIQLSDVNNTYPKDRESIARQKFIPFEGPHRTPAQGAIAVEDNFKNYGKVSSEPTSIPTIGTQNTQRKNEVQKTLESLGISLPGVESAVGAVDYNGAELGDKRGNYNPKTKRVLINPNLTGSDFAATAAHEYGHAYDFRDSKGGKTTAGESARPGSVPGQIAAEYFKQNPEAYKQIYGYIQKKGQVSSPGDLHNLTQSEGFARALGDVARARHEGRDDQGTLSTLVDLLSGKNSVPLGGVAQEDEPAIGRRSWMSRPKNIPPITKQVDNSPIEGDWIEKEKYPITNREKVYGRHDVIMRKLAGLAEDAEPKPLKYKPPIGGSYSYSGPRGPKGPKGPSGPGGGGPPNEPPDDDGFINLPKTWKGAWNRITLNKKIKTSSIRAGLGIAGAAAVFAPYAAENLFGSAEKPGYFGTTGAKVGAAGLGALGGIGAGAATGAAIGGPVGLVIGAVTGLVSAFKGASDAAKEFDNEVVEIAKREKTKGFDSETKNYFSNDHSRLSESAQESFSNLVNFGTSNNLRKAGLNAGDVSIDKIRNDKLIPLSTNRKGELGRFSKAEKVDTTTLLGIANENEDVKERASAIFQKELQSGRINKGNFDEYVNSDVGKNIVQAHVNSRVDQYDSGGATARQAVIEQLRKEVEAVEKTIRVYDEVNFAFSKTVSNLHDFSVAIGHSTEKLSRGFSDSTALASARVGQGGVGALRLTTGALGEQGKKLNNIAGEGGELERIEAGLSPILEKAFTEHAKSPESSISEILKDVLGKSDLGKGLSADTSKQIVNAFQQPQDATRLEKDFKTGGSAKVIGEVLKNFSSVRDSFNKVKQNLDKAGSDFISGLEHLSANVQKIGEIHDKAVNTATTGNRLQAEFTAANNQGVPTALPKNPLVSETSGRDFGNGRSTLGYSRLNNLNEEQFYRAANPGLQVTQGVQAIDRLSVSDLNYGNQKEQERLTGLRGSDAMDPTAIASRIQVQQMGLGQALESQRKAEQSGDAKGALAAAGQVNSFSHQLADSTKALENLTDASKMTAAAQEKLARVEQQLEGDRKGRLSYAENYINASPQERSRMNRNEFSANAAISQGNFAGMSDKQIKGALEFLNQAGETQLQTGVDRKGNATFASANNIKEQLLLNSGFGGQDRRNPLFGQRQALQGQVNQGFAAAQEASKLLVSNLNGANEKFLGDMRKLFGDYFKIDTAGKTNPAQQAAQAAPAEPAYKQNSLSRRRYGNTPPQKSVPTNVPANVASESLAKATPSMNNLADSAKTLATALSKTNIPSQVTHTFSGNVNVNLNGAEVMGMISGELKKLIYEEINAAIQKTNQPKYGV